LGSNTLATLVIDDIADAHLLDGPSTALLGNALHANRSLTSFSFNATVWHDADVSAALLGALANHHSLRTLDVAGKQLAPAACAALGALVAANAPALTSVDASNNNLRDAGLRPLCDALPRNTHLRELNVARNGMSVAFARDVLLPAVRANTSLRALRATRMDVDNDSVREMRRLLAARAAA
jgi:hypothetical protein